MTLYRVLYDMPVCFLCVKFCRTIPLLLLDHPDKKTTCIMNDFQKWLFNWLARRSTRGDPSSEFLRSHKRSIHSHTEDLVSVRLYKLVTYHKSNFIAWQLNDEFASGAYTIQPCKSWSSSKVVKIYFKPSQFRKAGLLLFRLKTDKGVHNKNAWIGKLEQVKPDFTYDIQTLTGDFCESCLAFETIDLPGLDCDIVHTTHLPVQWYRSIHLTRESSSSSDAKYICKKI